MQNLANLSNLSGLGVSGGSLFKPNALFRDGEQGVWFDPSDMSTLFQDSAGTTPVTGVEQPVGLMLDKSRGVELESDIWQNGGYLLGQPSAFTDEGGGSYIIGRVEAGLGSVQGPNLKSRQLYEVTFTAGEVDGFPYGGVHLRQVGTTLISLFPNPGTYTVRVVSVLTSSRINFAVGSGVGIRTRVSNISVREVLGNHALQATSASRPTLSARVNMLVNTDTLSTQDVTVAKQDYTLRFEGSGSVRDTVPLGQGSRNWYGMTTLGSDVYAVVYAGDIYKQTEGTGNFEPLGQASRAWRGMTTLGSDVYASVSNGDIYKQTGGTGDFVALGQTSSNWRGMTTLGSDVYVSVYEGDIYKQTGGTGNFEPLGQTSRAWWAMTTLGSDVYAVVYGGDIYKQTGGTGDFVALGQATRSWWAMTTLGSDVYAVVHSGDIYKQTGGTGNFVALGQTSRRWYGMTTLGSDVYASVYEGDIYKISGTPRTAGSYTIPSGAGAMSLVVEGTVSNADLRPSNVGNLPPYQRVGNVGTTPSDYNDVGFPKYLRFDGVDDALETNTIDFSSTDEMNVFAGVRKVSDVATGILAETSITSDTNNGSFALVSPSASGENSFRFNSRGSLLRNAGTGQFAIAPTTDILTGISDISADTVKLRVNGSQVAASTGDQGTGNYRNYPLYIGAKAGTSLFFNGNLYQLLIRGKLSTDSQVRGTEKFISKKTGL